MYLMESSREAARLEAKTDATEVRRRLELVGVRPGMCVLDAGAGSGAVSRVLAEMVGPQGEVVALEREPGRVAFIDQRAREAGIMNLRAVEGDLFDPPLDAKSFDLVWCQFVLEYLPDAALAVEALADLAARGGKVALADLDGNALFHYPMTEEMREASEKLERGLRGVFDPYAGRKLYSHLRRAGLKDIGVHMLPYHLYAGSAPAGAIANWRQKFETLREAGSAILGAREYERWTEGFLTMLADEDVFTYSALFIAEGRVK